MSLFQFKKKEIPPQIIEVLGYEELLALKKFLSIKYKDSSCFGYIDSIQKSTDGTWGITVYVDPCGNVTRWGNSFVSVLGWWSECFRFQPKDLDYVQAAWQLYEVKDNLPKDPFDVWNI